MTDKPISLTPVNSSNVAKVGYCPDQRCIAVEFKNGGLYHYQNCDQGLYDSMLKSSSIGSFIATQLKPAKECVKQ